MRVMIIDAFTDKPGMGNPAGVVFLKHALPTEAMQLVAKQVGVSETAFLQEIGPNMFRTRFFTPLREVHICGHATIASFFQLASTKTPKDKPAVERFAQHSNAGKLAIEIHRGSENVGPVIWMQLDRPEFTDWTGDPGELLIALGVEPASVAANLPLQVAQKNRVFIPLSSLDHLLSLQPDLAELSRISSMRGIRGITPYTLETANKKAFTHLRHFAPVAGVNEDPVTGTSNGYLGYLLMQTGVLQNAQGIEYIGEQGHALGKDGTVQVRITPGGELWIGGTACSSAEIEVNEGVSTSATSR